MFSHFSLLELGHVTRHTHALTQHRFNYRSFVSFFLFSFILINFSFCPVEFFAQGERLKLNRIKISFKIIYNNNNVVNTSCACWKAYNVFDSYIQKWWNIFQKTDIYIYSKNCVYLLIKVKLIVNFGRNGWHWQSVRDRPPGDPDWRTSSCNILKSSGILSCISTSWNHCTIHL